MEKQDFSFTQKQKHIIQALKYLTDDGDYKKASGLVDKAENDRDETTRTEGHPMHTFCAENAALTDLIQEEILPSLKKWQQDGKDGAAFAKLKAGLKKLRTVKYHYERKENTMYSFFVKADLISENTSSQMWGVNDKVCQVIEEANDALKTDPLPDKYLIEAKVEAACDDVLWIIFIEKTVFVPILSLITSAKDWYMLKRDELEIGYTLIDFPKAWAPTEDAIRTSQLEKERLELMPELRQAFTEFLNKRMTLKAVTPHQKVLRGNDDYLIGDETSDPSLVFPDLKDITVKMEIGSLSLAEIPAIFNVLPIDLTFVDKYDKVKWFSNTDRVFPRTRSVIGRPVIRCHPPKSIDKVMEILENFHQGMADSEDFWVTLHGRTIYLCFYAVRDKSDNYLGCLETVQDITKFKTVQGQKTLENKDQFKD